MSLAGDEYASLSEDNKRMNEAMKKMN